MIQFHLQKGNLNMKIFISACMAFLLTFTLVIYTSVSTKNIIEDMILEINTLESMITDDTISDDANSILQNIERKWEDHRFLLCLSISRKESDDIDISMKLTQAAFESGDIGLYKVYLTAFSEKLTKLSESETFSLEGIL